MNVDVVIPVFNGRKYVGETLASVFRQSLRPGKVIVIDDGSTDGSAQFLSRFKDIVLARNPGRGAPSARNRGLRRASAPLVAFLDQDDLWHPRHLEILSALLAANPGLDAAVSGIKTFADGDEPRFEPDDTGTDYFNPWDIYPTHDMACTPGMALFRRRAIIAAGNWREDHKGISDYSLLMTLSVAKPIVRTHARTLAYRRRKGSATAYLKSSPSRYLALSLKADDDLLGTLLSSDAESQAKAAARRRNAVAHYMAEIIEALAARDPARTAAAAQRLEAGLEQESYEYRRSLLLYLFYMYRNFCAGMSCDGINRSYAILLDALPAGASLSRKALIELLVAIRPGLAFYCRYYAARPWRADRLAPFTAALSAKVSHCLRHTRAQRPKS